jgi:hypothetical protein
MPAMRIWAWMVAVVLVGCTNKLGGELSVDGEKLVGKDLGACGSLEIEDQNSTVNDVKNVEGKATLDCAADGVAVKGSVTFENCH